MKKSMRTVKGLDHSVEAILHRLLYWVPNTYGTVYNWALNSKKTGLEEDCFTLITNKGCFVVRDLTKSMTDGVIHPCQLSDKWCWSSPDPTMLERHYFDNPEIATLIEALLVEGTTELPCKTILVFNNSCNIMMVPTTDKQIVIKKKLLVPFFADTPSSIMLTKTDMDIATSNYVNSKLRQFKELRLK